MNSPLELTSAHFVIIESKELVLDRLDINNDKV